MHFDNTLIINSMNREESLIQVLEKILGILILFKKRFETHKICSTFS